MPILKPRSFLPAKLHLSAEELSVLLFSRKDLDLQKPFFAQSVAEMFSVLKSGDVLQRQVFESVRRVALLKVPKQNRPDVQLHFIFHVSRCGSTLLTQFLKHHPSVLAISEPELLHHFTVGEYYDHPQANQILQNLVQHFINGLEPTEKNLIIKLSSWDLYLVDLFFELFPGARFYFNVRDFDEVYQSLVEDHPPSPSVPRRLREQLGWGPVGLLESTQFPKLLRDYLGILQRIFETKSVDENEAPFRQLISYNSLCSVTADQFLNLFQLDPSPGFQREFEDQRRIYSKDPNQKSAFTPRPRNELLRSSADPTYQDIQNLCLMQSQFSSKFKEPRGL